MLFWSAVLSVSAQSQQWMPIPLDPRGDTIPYTYPPPDTGYVRNHLILKFAEGAQNYELLCYRSNQYLPSDEMNREALAMSDISDSQREFLLSQRFHIDSGIVISAQLRDAIKSFGGSYLMRLTTADPCIDTISIARNGDTLRINHHTWMLLELNNDTSVVAASIALTMGYRDQLELAQPNFLGSLHDRIPDDPDFMGMPQRSMALIGIPYVWDTQVGNYGIKVGVIDDGIDYRHCDFGAGRGLGYKVVGGYNYLENNSNILYRSFHGTSVAGIIGALTNSGVCGISTHDPEGIAGVSGGWTTEGKLGAQLMAFRAIDGEYDMDVQMSKVISAMLESIASPPYGYGVHVLNMSLGFPAYARDEAMRSALNDAYWHKVSVVASRGNSDYGAEAPEYPAAYDNPWIVSVGGGDRNRDRISYSSYGLQTDLIAPGGNKSDPLNQIVWTTEYDGRYRWFDGTSAAAPHVSGVLALLRSEAFEKGWNQTGSWWNLLEPEDYEGMLKASAIDRNTETTPNSAYLLGYDNQTGWGHLQADNIFQMLNSGYTVTHYVIDDNLSFGPWSASYLLFLNERPGSEEFPDYGCMVRRREVSVTYTLPQGRWDRSNGNKLYVWGYGGYRAGWSRAEPVLYTTPYTEVISGEGGNNLTEGIWQPDNSMVVTARTYQYEVTDLMGGTNLGIFPSNAVVSLNFSVFGKDLASSVRTGDGAGEISRIMVTPNPASNSFTIEYRLEKSSMVQIVLYDALGRIVIQSDLEAEHPGLYTTKFNTAGINPGIYICTVVADDMVMTSPVSIIR